MKRRSPEWALNQSLFRHGWLQGIAGTSPSNDSSLPVAISSGPPHFFDINMEEPGSPAMDCIGEKPGGD